jgi:hypothetical protein
MTSKRIDIKITAIQMAILAVLCGWLFYPELKHMTAQVTSSSSSVHSLVAPLAMILLIYCRRENLVAQMTTGTFWGLAFMGSGLFLYAACRWPFDFGYARYLAIIPVLAGIILIGGGWRLFYSTLPLLLVLMIAIPMGSRLWSTLIIRPETYSIAAGSAILDLLPGTQCVIQGTDLFLTDEPGATAVAVGESNRGARLLLVYLLIGVFVAFSQVRSTGRIVFLAISAIPVVFLCNLLRFLTMGLLTFLTDLGPTSSGFRNGAAIVSLLAAYGLFSLLSLFKLNIYVEETESDAESAEP